MSRVDEHIVVGAGARGFTSEPSGATMLVGRYVPEFLGIEASREDTTAV